MDKKQTKSTKIWSPQNKQTYPTEQIVTDNTIKHVTHNTVATAGNFFDTLKNSFLCEFCTTLEN